MMAVAMTVRAMNDGMSIMRRVFVWEDVLEEGLSVLGFAVRDVDLGDIGILVFQVEDCEGQLRSFVFAGFQVSVSVGHV